MKKPVLWGMLMSAVLVMNGCQKPAGDEASAQFRGPLTVSGIRQEARTLEQAMLEALNGVAAQGGGPIALDGPQVQQLKRELEKLHQMRQAMEQAPAGERQALQQAWMEVATKLRELAKQVVQTGAFSADVYGPVLSEILKQLDELTEVPAS